MPLDRIISNPSSDPGRNQPRKAPVDVSEASNGQHQDPDSMLHNPGGAATTRKTWFGNGYEPGGDSHERTEAARPNGPAPRDRGRRAS